MISWEELDLPATTIAALKAAGLKTVENLCALTLHEVGSIPGVLPDRGRIDAIRTVRKALGKHGLDLRGPSDDPVGMPVTPSRRALHNLFDRLDLAPVTRETFKNFLLGAILTEELLAAIAPEDREKSLRLLDLMGNDT